MKFNGLKTWSLLASLVTVSHAAALPPRECTLQNFITSPEEFGNDVRCSQPLGGNHSTEWFSAINTDRHREALSRRMLGLKDALDFERGRRVGRFYQPVFDKDAMTRLSSMTEKDVAACQHEECCLFLSDAIRAISSGKLKSLTTTCLDIIAIDAMNGTSGRDAGILSLIPANVLARDGHLIIRRMKVLSESSKRLNTIDTIPHTVLGHILSNKVACKQLSDDDWARLLRTPRKISTSCAHAGQRALSRAYRPGSKASFLEAKVFADYNRGLNDSLIPTLSVSQVANFAKNVEIGQLPGKNLKINELGSNAEGLTFDLMLSWIYSNENNRLGLTKLAMSKLSNDFFDALKPDDADAFSKAMENKEFQILLSKSHLVSLTKHSEVCTILDPVTLNRKFDISEGCFLSMKPETQAAAIVKGGPLPNNVLADITGTKVKNWKYENIEGLDVLTFGVKHSNLPEIIASLGNNVEFDHPCGLIEDVNALKALPILQKHMTLRCASKMGFKLEASDYMELTPRVTFLQTFAELKKTRKPEFWKKMNHSTFAILASNGVFCAQVDKETLLSIDRSAFKGMSHSCFHQLTFVDDLPLDVIQAIPSSVFDKETSATISAKVVSMMTAEQIGVVGSAAPEGNSIGAHLSESVLDGFTNDHYGRIQTKHWKEVKPEAFKAFSKAERLAAVQGDAMAHWSKEQVSNIPKHIIGGLTPAQAEGISKSVDAKSSALHVLTDDIEFSSEVKGILQRRRKEAGIVFASDQEGDNATMYIIIVCVVAVIAIGAGVYFWMRSRNQ